MAATSHSQYSQPVQPASVPHTKEEHYQAYHQTPRPSMESLPGKDYGTQRRGKGRGGSRGRGSEEYSSGRGVAAAPRGGGGPTSHYSQPRVQDQVATAVVRVEPPRPAPEFNMKTNDFPALPGAPAPTLTIVRKQVEVVDPATPWESSSSRFLDVVKGTAKVKLGDESDSGQNTKENSPVPPDDQDSIEGCTASDTQEPVDTAKHQIKYGERSKTSSVSETPVVSVDTREKKDSSHHPLINGEVKTGKTPLVSINNPSSYNESSSESISPRTQSLEALGPKLTYAQMAQKKKEAKEREAAEAAAAAAAAAGLGSGGTTESRVDQSKVKDFKQPQSCKGEEDKKDTSNVITSDCHDRDTKQRLVKTLSQPGDSRPGDTRPGDTRDKIKGRGSKRLERTDSGPPVQTK